MKTILLGLLIGFALTQVANLATTVYLHRAIAHRAVTLSRPVSAVFRFVIWLTTGIRPRQWAAVHRKHHAFTDTPEDPHSPAQLGWVRVQFANVALYRRVAGDEEQVLRHARDLPRTRLDAVLYDHALLGLGIGLVVLALLTSPLVAAIAGVTHVVLYLGLSGSVNAVAHTFGKRPYANSATNVWWLAGLTMGEGFHNNHHAAPTSARFSLQRWQLDPGWLVIRALASLRLASIRHVTPVLTSERRAEAA